MYVSFPDRLKGLGFGSYADYLRSSHWKRVRAAYVRSGRPRQCLVCGSDRSQLHHVTYDRLGAEALDDLVPICSNHHRPLHAVHRKRGIPLSDYKRAVSFLVRRLACAEVARPKPKKRRQTRTRPGAAGDGKPKSWHEAPDVEGRILNAVTRLKTAQAALVVAEGATRVLLARASIDDGYKRGGEVSRLYKAYLSRGMATEAAKLRTYLDALAEVFGANQSLDGWEKKAREHGLRPAPVGP